MTAQKGVVEIERLPVQQAMSAEDIIIRAIDQNVPVETMERLLAMRERINAEKAKNAYYVALSEFQSDLPPIKKTREVKDKSGKVRYSYASLDDIIQQVAPYLKKHGLSFTVETQHKEGSIVATCRTHHVLGYGGESSFPVPIEKEAFMNEAQKSASAQSYAKRYAFCNAFGIVTGDYDDDAQSVGESVSAADIYKRMAYHAQMVRDNWDAISRIREGIATKNYDIAAEAWEELDNDTKTALWLAPTKGGIFSTDERTIIHSDEFSAYRKKFKEPEVQAPEETINRIHAAISEASSTDLWLKAKGELDSAKHLMSAEQFAPLVALAHAQKKRLYETAGDSA